MKDIAFLRYWCHKILPLVYEDSLSYYEVLCKMKAKLNEVIENVNEIPEYIDKEIEEKLDDDHLREIIEAFIQDYKHTISSNDDGDSATATQSWDMGTWLWLGDTLYITTKDIVEGNAYVFSGENRNVKPITVESESEVVYYPNDKKLSIHGKISDYGSIVTAGDYHVYNPTRQAIEIKKVE